MLIIVEGPDGSGKSTLLQKLSLATGREALHSGGPPKSAEEAMKRLEFLKNAEGMILDRSVATSEIVYGNNLRGKPVVDQEILEETIRLLISRGAVFVFCRPPNRVLLKNLLKIRDLSEDKAWKNEDHVKAVEGRYWNIVNDFDSLFCKIVKWGGIVLRYEWEFPCAE